MERWENAVAAASEGREIANRKRHGQDSPDES